MKRNNKTELKEIIERGLKIMYSRLLEKAIKEDDDLVVGDENGNPIRVKATILKARLQ